MISSARMQAATAKAIAVAGGPTALSAALTKRGTPLSRPAISNWKLVPPKHARAVSEITGIPLHNLRPDLWDRPKKA